MSLDVYLIGEPAPVSQTMAGKIFIREDGRTKEISSEEWTRRFPDREPVVLAEKETSNWVYSANITHNMTAMADEAGIYDLLWRPEEIGVTYARQVVEPLAEGIRYLLADPEHMREFDPPNGWGSYEVFLEFCRDYLEACEAFPDARVEVSR